MTRTGSYRNSLSIHHDPKYCAKIVELHTVHKLTIKSIAERYSVSPSLIKQILTEANDVGRQIST